MSQQSAIDALLFSVQGRHMAGQVACTSLSRLRDLLVDPEGVVEFELAGITGEDGEPLLQLGVRALLQLRCQRCLQAMDFRLNVEQVFELRDQIDDGTLTQEDLEDDSRDYLPTSRQLDVVALVEDEALLALPLVARHESCQMPEQGDNTEAASPFGVLLKLKGLPGKTH